MAALFDPRAPVVIRLLEVYREPDLEELAVEAREIEAGSEAGGLAPGLDVPATRKRHTLGERHVEVRADVDRLAGQAVQRHPVEGTQVTGLAAQIEPIRDPGGEGGAEAQQRGILVDLGGIGPDTCKLPN